MFLTKLLTVAGDVEEAVSEVVSEAVESSGSTPNAFIEGLIEKTSENASLADKLVAGLQVALIGMAVVFAVLLLLMAILSVFKLFAVRSAKPKAAEAPVAAQPASSVPTGNEEEIAAVLTAAVAAMNNKTESGYKVISIKKIVE